MEFQIDQNDGEDFGTVYIIPGQDDSFVVGGIANRGEISIKFSLYSHEAKRLVDALRELAETEAIS